MPTPQLSAEPLFGALAPFLTTPGLTDLIVGPDGTLWGESDSQPGLQRLSYHSLEEEECRTLAVTLAHAAGVRLDDAHPWADGIITVGQQFSVRLHAVLATIAPQGTTISLRILRPHHTTLHDLQESGMISPQDCSQLVRYVHEQRSIVVTGATGTGKTTLLAALLSILPATERIVTIEDTPELAVPHPQLVQLLTRTANTENIGEITMQTLLRQALRMRPDRIVVGEVRGPEVVDLLGALNTGHRGALASLHANSPADVAQRILGLALPTGLAETAICQQMRTGLDIIAHLERDPRTGRRTLACLEEFAC